MRFIAILMLALFALSGCTSGDDPENGAGEGTDGADGEGGATVPVDPIIKKDGYTLNTETGQCDATDYENVGGSDTAYTSNFGGGDWVFQESNGIPGLQYEDNHPASNGAAGTSLGVDSRCINGDQVVF